MVKWMILKYVHCLHTSPSTFSYTSVCASACTHTHSHTLTHTHTHSHTHTHTHILPLYFFNLPQIEESVARERFDHVCEELNKALRREQEVQELLNEQSQQIQQLGLTLDIQRTEDNEKEYTLSQAVKVMRLILTLNGALFTLIRG